MYQSLARISHQLTVEARDQPAKLSVSYWNKMSYKELALFGNAVSR